MTVMGVLGVCLTIKIANRSHTWKPENGPRAGGTDSGGTAARAILGLGHGRGSSRVVGAADDEVGDLLSAFDAVVRAEKGLVGQLSARAGIHETGLRALALVEDTGYSTATELAGYLGLTSGAVTNMVDRLSDAGLVERRPNPSDRRGSLIVLSPDGARVIAGARDRYAAVLRQVGAQAGVDLTSVFNDVATGLLQQSADAQQAADAQRAAETGQAAEAGQAADTAQGTGSQPA